ncbi:MAG: hypothetical protein HC780_19845 [Leptolyngbyaceae cyanobacterium CSU_1_3]|nr:hypothetical protein [Leptolyngbyaceae cyanobacterium CSU_1_3]
MALTKKAHTVRLLNFEEELLTQLSEQKGQTEEQMLLAYIRTGLKREKLEGLESYKQREKKAVADLYTERVETLYRPTKAKKEKHLSQNNTEGDDEGNTDKSTDATLNSVTEIQSGEPDSFEAEVSKRSHLPNVETDLEQQFMELATLFDLATPISEQVMVEQHYLLKGQKELRIVVIKQVQSNGTVQFQISNEDSDKSHSLIFKRFAENAKGAIAEAQIEELQARLLN